MRNTAAAVFLIFASLASARAQEEALPADPEPSLGGLQWLAGSWRGEGLGGHFEEHWTKASGGTMLGVFRLVREKQEQVTEYVMITEQPGGVTMRFKHFNTDYTTWEDDEPLEFTLISLSDHNAVFHSDIPGQRSPRRIIYELTDGGDSLSAVVMSLDDDGRLKKSFDLRFSRD